MPDDAGRLRKQLSTLAAFGGAALRSDDVGALLQEATRLVSEAVDIELVKVLQLLPDGRTMLVRAGVNWNPGVVGHATIPALGGSSAGHALRTNAPVISENVEAEDRFSVPRLLFEHGVVSTVNVVIRGEGEPFGVLEVDSRRPRRFGQDDIDFLQNYANLLAAAIERADAQRKLADAAQRQQVLSHELQHRINNMLTTIRAIARRTRAKSSGLDEFAKAFDDRLAALARTHDLLAKPGTSALDLRELLWRELSAQGAVEGENVFGHGPDTAVPAKQAQVLCLAVHELATNAVKYGALSVRHGRIDISWDHVDPGRLRIRWRELGVAIEREPVRRGYGSDILDRSIPAMLEGAIERRFHADGVECVIEFAMQD